MTLTVRHALAIGYLLADLAIYHVETDALRIAQFARDWYCSPTDPRMLREMREARGKVSVRRSAYYPCCTEMENDGSCRAHLNCRFGRIIIRYNY